MTRPLEVVAGAMLPAPPYPADTRNRGWGFSIDLPRVRQSDTWSLCAAEFRPWLIWLWVKSWEEIPTGSYPNDDAIIAAKIGMTFELFDGHRAMLMRGWYRANDNRLYHPYITELVRGRIAWKEAERARQAAYRARRTDEPTGVVTPDKQNVTRDNTGQTRDNYDTGSGSGSGSGSKDLDVELPKTSIASGKGRGAGEGNPKRATRLPQGWRLPDEWRDWAIRTYHLEPDRVVRISLQFRDHWYSAPPSKATKSDWLATWRLWIRRQVGDV